MGSHELDPRSSARDARQLLAGALGSLQLLPAPPAQARRAIAALAAAANALYETEQSAPPFRAAPSHVRIAMDKLGEALSELKDMLAHWPDVELALQSVGRTLALLYPVAQAQQRQRRDVVMRHASPSIPPPPARSGRPRRTPPFAGAEKRRLGNRFFVEVDVGLFSESHFYTGLSGDVSRGGLFVSTFEPLEPGTEVTLNFLLPNGRLIRADGVVRWTRDAGADAPPGMGVAFYSLTDADRAAIEAFCAEREPLLAHLQGD